MNGMREFLMLNGMSPYRAEVIAAGIARDQADDPRDDETVDVPPLDEEDDGEESP